MGRIVMLISAVACYPLGWAGAELFKAGGNDHAAGCALLFSVTVAILGLWGVHWAYEIRGGR